MTGYLTTCQGEIWQLPDLYAWQYTRTDGSCCDEAQVEFIFEPSRLQVLQDAVRLRLTHEGKTVYYGVVDEVEAVSSQKGRTVRLCSRGLQALLMDNELPPALYATVQMEDALSKFVLPFGVERVREKSLPPLRNYAVETGNTPWQALCGYCRHSAGLQPCFSADGTLLFEAEAGKTRHLGAEEKVLKTEYRICRYGVISRQMIVSATRPTEIQERPQMSQKGVQCQKVTMRQGEALKADWRTASQRLDDSAKDAVEISLTLAGDFDALPGDRIAVNLPASNVQGEYLLRSIRKSASKAGKLTELTLEGVL